MRRTEPREARRAAAGATALALVLGGCAPEAPAGAHPVTAGAPSRWIRLAQGFEPGPLAEVVAAWNARGGALVYRAEEDGVLVEAALASAGWKPGRAGRWSHALPAELEVEPLDKVRLEVAGQTLRIPSPSDTGPRASLQEDEVVLVLRDANADAPLAPTPPGEARFALWVERATRGRCAEIQDARTTIEDGLVVWSGERAERVCDVPAGSVLRFQKRLRPLVRGARVTFRVRLDGEVVYEELDAAPLPARPAVVVVSLGAQARPGARLAFEVDGDPAATAFAQPVIGPAELGTSAARPWSDARPDVVLFLADTFRADLLALHGGEPGTTPALDALAARSVRFTETRAPSTWTLPSQASMFTGVWPPQHGAELYEHALAPEFATLAEHFERAGYRTAAVTDGLYLSRAYGFDQGFQWFQVLRDLDQPRLTATLATARALVDADDGRPLFLFVHSYRMHWPYRSGAEEDARVARRLRHEANDLAGRIPDERERALALEPITRAMHAEYRLGARDLDAQLGAWFAGLEELGLFRRGLFVFTSDHGEQFGEHGGISHGGSLHDEEARIPLFVFGGGEAPRAIALGASLVDLSPTLAARCGLEPSSLWQGRDLFTLVEDRPIYSTVLSRHTGRHVGIVHGRHKILAAGSDGVRLPGDLAAAYALAEDPRETEDVLGGAEWPRELAARVAAGWEAQQAPLVETEAAELDEELLDELRRLGYGK